MLVIIKNMKKGFTLLELLIVIGVLAILATTVTVVLNPAELLKQARDSQRIGDLSAVKSAISLYISSATTPAFGADPIVCTNTCASGNPFAGAGIVSTSTKVDGTGWVKVNFADVPGGSPLAKLPIDPVNSATYFYGYSGDATNLVFELDTKLESAKYSGQMTNDGGNNPDWYETGTDPDLNI